MDTLYYLFFSWLIWAYFMANQNEIIKNDLKTKNDILMKKLFSAQGNMAQLRTKLKYYKSLNK